MNKAHPLELENTELKFYWECIERGSKKTIYVPIQILKVLAKQVLVKALKKDGSWERQYIDFDKIFKDSTSIPDVDTPVNSSPKNISTIISDFTSDVNSTQKKVSPIITDCTLDVKKILELEICINNETVKVSKHPDGSYTCSCLRFRMAEHLAKQNSKQVKRCQHIFEARKRWGR